MYKVIIKEQKPLECGSILCEITLKAENHNSFLIMRNMYFVCNLEKRVTQYPNWLDSEQKYKQEIINLGYKFK